MITDPATEELAASIHVSPLSMAHRIAAARQVSEHPHLLDLQTQGGITPYTVQEVFRVLRNLPREAEALVIEALVAKLWQRIRSGARPWTTAEVTAATKRLKLRLCQAFLDEAKKLGLKDRSVWVSEDADGMATLIARIPAVDAERILRRLTVLARQLQDDPDGRRTLEQQKADLFVDTLLAATTGEIVPGTPPAVDEVGLDNPGAGGTDGEAAQTDRHTDPGGTNGGPRRPLNPDTVVNVVVSIATLLGLVDEPGELACIGPIDSDTARELAADSRWRLWIMPATSGPHRLRRRLVAAHLELPGSCASPSRRARAPSGGSLTGGGARRPRTSPSSTAFRSRARPVEHPDGPHRLRRAAGLHQRRTYRHCGARPPHDPIHAEAHRAADQGPPVWTVTRANGHSRGAA